jgi:DNA-binding NtrC family response regulator
MVARSTEAVAFAFGPAATLGRTVKPAGGPSVDIDDDRMSREHATVRYERGYWVITDHESRNGTHVDGERVRGEVRRRGDTVLRLGHSVFVLLADASGHPAPLDGDAVIGPELARAYAQIMRAAHGAALLLHAEPGAGKEVAARVYHQASPRKAGPFVSVNCAAIPDGVADRMLFGGKRGVVASIGQFQLAAGGTIFLDDVATLSPAVQAKLRGVLENPGDLGVVAAAHAELRMAVADGRFDGELYRRLAQTTVTLPPLRERKVDIARLVQREVAAVDAKLRPHAKLVEACLLRPWPGNVRELQAAIRKAALEVRARHQDVVRADDLDPGAGHTLGGGAAETAVERPKRQAAPAELDKATVERALAQANGVVHVAARNLGIHRSQLYQLMDQHGIVFTDE